MHASERIPFLQKALEQNPQDTFVQFALGMEYLHLEQYDEALRYFESVVTHDPDYTGVYYHLGKLYALLGRPTQAQAILCEGMRRTEYVDPQTHRELKQALDELLAGEDESFSGQH